MGTQRRTARFGLWWRVFSDDDTFELLPRNTLWWSGLWLAVLAAVLCLAPQQMALCLAAPVLCVLFNLLMTYLLDSLGLVLSGPALAFGVGTLGWLMGTSGSAMREGAGLASYAVMLCLAALLVFAVRDMWASMRMDMIALVVEAVLLWFAGRYYGGQAHAGMIGIGPLKFADAVDAATVRTVYDGIFLVSILVAVGFAAYYVRQASSSAAGMRFARRKAAWLAAALVAGCVPLGLVGLVPEGSATYVLLVTLGTYALLAALATWMGRRVEAWLLVPLLVGATLGILSQANPEVLVPYDGFAMLVDFCRHNALAQSYLGSSLLVVNAFAYFLAGPLLGLADMATDLVGPDGLPLDLLQTLSLPLGLVLVASAMGVAGYGAERLRKRRQLDERDQEAPPLSPAGPSAAAYVPAMQEPVAFEKASASLRPKATDSMERPSLRHSKKLLDTPYIKVFELVYRDGTRYLDASRRDADDLLATKAERDLFDSLPDAVSCCLVLEPKDGEPLLVMFYEYRYPTGQYVLSIPSGLIDDRDLLGANPLRVAMTRELAEETGVVLRPGDALEVVNPLLFNSPGMTDESTALLCARVRDADVSVLAHPGAEGTERFGGFELATRADVERILRDGHDRFGHRYPLVTWAAMTYFLHL